MYGRLPGWNAWIDIDESGHPPLRVRNRWEAQVARELIRRGEVIEYEAHRFVLKPGMTYCPDFYLPKRDVWIEVKGRIKARDDEIRALFPERLVWITRTEMNNLDVFLSSILPA